MLYVQQTGALQVNIGPAAAAGAQWPDRRGWRTEWRCGAGCRWAATWPLFQRFHYLDAEQSGKSITNALTNVVAVTAMLDTGACGVICSRARCGGGRDLGAGRRYAAGERGGGDWVDTLREPYAVVRWQCRDMTRRGTRLWRSRFRRPTRFLSIMSCIAVGGRADPDHQWRRRHPSRPVAERVGSRQKCDLADQQCRRRTICFSRLDGRDGATMRHGVLGTNPSFDLCHYNPTSWWMANFVTNIFLRFAGTYERPVPRHKRDGGIGGHVEQSGAALEGDVFRRALRKQHAIPGERGV